MRRPILAVIPAMWLIAAVAHAAPEASSPALAAKSPADSLQCLKVPAEVRVELVAAEPLVADPIAIAWGTDGKLWVVEMGDYPLSDRGGRICFLQDRNQDGVFDCSTVFLDELSFPTGVLPWRKGILVSCAPDILYAEDTNADGKADIRQVLFRGFAKGNPQHCVNGLRWGLDNWVHCSNGDSGGIVQSLASGERISILGHDVRVCPRRGLLETLSGMSQFGRCRDDWGNWFGCSNVWPSWHVVLEDRYLRRNTALRSPNSIQHLMTPPTGAPVYPANRGLPRLNEPELANRFTSACGIGVYRDTLFGAAFENCYFVCEPAHNLVRHEVLVHDGVSFKSHRAAGTQPEFLTSSDTCFRPTQVRTGPDGALWCVDMYRAVIEHPEYIPDPSGLPLRDGAGMGRIYRVVPAHQPLRPVPRLEHMGSHALANSLDTPNGPVRDLVQQTIVERQDRSAVDVLERLALHNDRAAVHVSSLCTLDGLAAVQTSLLVAALADPHPAVRRQAVRISEPMIAACPPLQSSLLQRISDPDLQVRLQLACSLGEWDDPRAAQALVRILIENEGGPFLETAVLSSATNHTLPMLQVLMERGEQQLPAIRSLMRCALSNDQPEVVTFVLGKLAIEATGNDQDWQLDLLADLLEALAGQGTSLHELSRHGDAELRASVDRLALVFTSARSMVLDEHRPATTRALAARVLGSGLDRQRSDMDMLAGLLKPQSPAPLQEAVVDALVRSGDAEVPRLLLKQWQQHTPEVRMQILDGLVSRAEWAAELLDQIDAGQISALSDMHRGLLLLHSSAEVRRRAAQLLTVSNPLREEVIARFGAALSMTGSKTAGERLFRANCSGCHRFLGTGGDVGPDLNTVGDRTPQKLLVDLLDPSRFVEPRYATYIAELNDGRVYSGVLKSAAGNSVTLAGSHSQEHLLLRSDVAWLESTERSMMPQDWERLLSTQDVADLIAYLQ